MEQDRSAVDSGSSGPEGRPENEPEPAVGDVVGWHLSYLRSDIAAAKADLEVLIEAARRRTELLDALGRAPDRPPDDGAAGTDGDSDE